MSNKVAIAKRVLFILILTVFIPIASFAQKKFVDLHAAAGSATLMYDPSPLNLLFPFPFAFPTLSYGLGASYSKKPVGLPFHVSAGISITRREFERTIKTNHLHIPLGIEFLLGKKVKFSLGSGLYPSLLFAYSKGNPDFEKNRSIVQLGAYFKAGLSVPINKRDNIAFHLLQMLDLSYLYMDSQYSPGGGSYGSSNYGLISLATFSYRRSLDL